MERALIGRRLGDYEITGKLGEGGMGQVYRARDHKLGRDVAIKILAPGLAGDRERMDRFDREARLLATVNHPSIGAIYGVIDIDGGPALVLELVDGETLSTVLMRGPLPLQKALSIGAHVAAALDHAHRRGITHRDLKPSNIIVTGDGIKLLDFGVGKWTPAATDATLTRAPALTGEGAIVGTLHYMSPEQLEGRKVDARSDIFSFGAVLFEMLSGRKAFDGPSQASIIAAIIEAPRPRLSSVGGPHASRVERVVNKCLAKQPEQRWQSAHDLGDELRWLAADADRPAPALPADVPRAASNRALVLGAALASVSALLIAGWMASGGRRSVAVEDGAAPIRFTLSSRGGEIFPVFDLSSNGRLAVYYVRRASGALELEARRLDRFETFAVPRINTGVLALSPDGEWVAYISGRSLKKSRVSADATELTLAEDVGPAVTFEAAWLAEHIYLVSRNHPIRRISENGGQIESVTTIQPQTDIDHHGPELLPGQDVLLYAVHGPRNRFSIAAQSLTTGERRTVVESGYAPRYLASGHLVFGRGSSLMTVEFDPRTLATRGDPVTAVEQVSGDPSSGDTNYRLSQNGLLMYVARAPRTERVLTWVDRAGRETPIAVPARAFNQPKLSPDGKHLAFTAGENNRGDVWTYDIASGTLSRLTEDGANWAPIWTQDGLSLIFGRDAGDQSQIVRQRVGGGTPQTLATSIYDLWATSIAADGTVFVTQDPPTSEHFLSVIRGSTFEPLLKNLNSPRVGRLSPDGRWLAYEETVSGRVEIFIQGYPNAEFRRQVTVDGGRNVMWRRDGRELYFRRGQGFYAMSIDTAASPKWGQPVRLFEGRYVSAAPWPDYDVAGDGRLILVKPAPLEGAAAPISVVVNWMGEVAGRVQAR